MAHTVQLRRDEFHDEAAARGYATQSAQADALGVHVSIHNRVMNGVTRELSGPYVVGVLWLFGDDAMREHLRQFFQIQIDDREPVAS